MNLGSKIKEMRLERGWTQEQLAGYLSVTVPCVSKWENHITMPDIQMLPQISVLFGVTIDELFNLTDDAHIQRIENMLERKKDLETEEFYRTELFLLKKEREEEKREKRGEYAGILADLYNHMADGCRRRAEKWAKEAIRLEPDKDYYHALLRMAQQGAQMDWNFKNQAKRIAYYQKFVREHPSVERGYVCLIDELLAAHRLSEAEAVISAMDRNSKSVRVLFYKGCISWMKNKREEAQTVWEEMLEKYPKAWLGYALLGDWMADYCEYETAVSYYEKSFELQEKPRYTDSQISIALLQELLGEKEKAVLAWEKVIEILEKEHNNPEAWLIGAARKEIERLKENAV